MVTSWKNGSIQKSAAVASVAAASVAAGVAASAAPLSAKSGLKAAAVAASPAVRQGLVSSHLMSAVHSVTKRANEPQHSAAGLFSGKNSIFADGDSEDDDSDSFFHDRSRQTVLKPKPVAVQEGVRHQYTEVSHARGHRHAPSGTRTMHSYDFGALQEATSAQSPSVSSIDRVAHQVRIKSPKSTG